MLSELMEREHWIVAPVLAGLMALPWAAVCAFAPGAVPVLFGGICFLFLLVGRFTRRTGVFEAALPISGRQIVAARVLMVLACLWFPALAMIAGELLMQGSKATTPLVEMAAVFTLVAMVPQSFGLREPSHSRRVGLLALLSGGAAILVPGVFSHWGEVTGGCMAASAVLGARLWVSAPVGFEIAPAKARRVRGTTKRRRSMLGQLLAQNPALKFAPVFALLVGVAYPLACMVSHGDTITMTFALSCLMVATGLPAERATVFEAALPIPGRQLMAARLIETFALWSLLGLVVIGETAVLRGWEDALRMLEMGAAATPLWLGVQSFGIRETSPPRWARNRMYLLGCAAWICFPGALDLRRLWRVPVLLGVCVIASAVLLVRLWHRAPEGFQVAPLRPVRPPRFTLRWPNWRSVWSPVWLPAWRSFLNPQTWIWLFSCWIFAALGMSLPLGVALVITTLSSLRRLEWLLVQPISRRRLLPMMLLPGLCVLIATVLVSGDIRLAREDPAVSTGHSDVWQRKPAAGPGTPNVLAPATYWNWAWGWQAPVIQSPWGETTQPKTFSRLGFAFYNPYSVAPHNSARFLDWQFARATEAVYGRAVPLAQSAELPKLGLIPVARRLRTRSIELLAAVLAFLGFFYLALWRKTSGGRIWAVLVGLTVLAPFGLDFLTTLRVIGSGMLSDIVTVRLAAILPQNWLALAVVAALLLGGAYLAVEKQFEKVDLIRGAAPRMPKRRNREFRSGV
jgi:hypothetical protein